MLNIKKGTHKRGIAWTNKRKTWEPLLNTKWISVKQSTNPEIMSNKWSDLTNLTILPPAYDLASMLNCVCKGFCIRWWCINESNKSLLHPSTNFVSCVSYKYNIWKVPSHPHLCWWHIQGNGWGCLSVIDISHGKVEASYWNEKWWWREMYETLQI